MGAVRRTARRARRAANRAADTAADKVESGVNELEERSNQVTDGALDQAGFEEGGFVRRVTEAGMHGVQGVSVGVRSMANTAQALNNGDIGGVLNASLVEPIEGAIRVAEETWDIFQGPSPSDPRGTAAAQVGGEAEGGVATYDATVGNRRRATPAAIRAQRRAYRSGGGGASGGAAIRV